MVWLMKTPLFYRIGIVMVNVCRLVLILSLLVLLPSVGKSQRHIRDSVISTTMFEISGGVNFPFADLKSRFGVHYNIGGGIIRKTKKNVLFGIDCHYLFGNKVKNISALFDGLITDDEDPFIISTEGIPAQLDVTMSGWAIKMNAGKLIQFKKPNPNSGLVITGGIGWTWYKYRIKTFYTPVPQLTGDYLKGYDQLTGGVLFNETIGYLFMGNSRLVNFFVGVEFMQSITQCYRPYNIAQGRKDNKTYFDSTINIKVAWLIPTYKRQSGDKYYY